ncbi:hypothetical protein G4177_10070 [Corallococcus sp. ZKHCc1 1396]|uniref:Peptidase C58 YopT-type domain-containing protein n=1 Tax=Corallococcus soli TaxID=2710757 RepID=A0ABR9PKU5_9BACT|nr:hypothetical protein [Corallococcus soli]MBE4748509.1 hypothetical protein [Corallococcus soli]
MYAKLYQTRYRASPELIGIIEQFTKTATGFGGTLECGFSQGREDLVTGASHPEDFTRDGICYALVAMWLRMKFEKKPDSDFHAWLFAEDVRARNAKMSMWMQKQLFAIDLGNPDHALTHSRFMALPVKGPRYEAFTTKYPKADLPAFVNFLSEQGAHGAPLDPSYDPAKYAAKQQRARYRLDTESRSYKLTQLNARMERLEIWHEAEISRADVYALQLAASKITKSATTANRLSSKDRIVSATLQASYVPDADEDGGKKRLEASQLIVDAMLKYQKELKNQDAFVLISFSRHVVGVFFSRSPWTGNGVLSFFDPNYGIWRFESSSRDERCIRFRKFFYVLTYLYREMDSLSIKILSRH